ARHRPGRRSRLAGTGGRRLPDRQRRARPQRPGLPGEDRVSDTLAAPDSRTTATARTVTDVLQPRNVLLAGMLGIGLAAAGEWTGLLWGLLGALCAGLIPAGYIEWERKRGTWGDRHVVDRTKRAPIFFVILGSIGAGSVVMLLGHAPAGILAAML